MNDRVCHQHYLQGDEVESWFWFTFIGLIADIAGASYIAVGLFISKQEAIELGVMRWAGETDEENLTVPAVRDRLRQATRVKWGLALLILGFALQAIGSWLSASSG